MSGLTTAFSALSAELTRLAGPAVGSEESVTVLAAEHLVIIKKQGQVQRGLGRLAGHVSPQSPANIIEASEQIVKSENSGTNWPPVLAQPFGRGASRAVCGSEPT